MSDTKHGWVTPRADGARARCGGPGVCATCNTEAMHEKMLTGLFGMPATAAPGQDAPAPNRPGPAPGWRLIESAPKDNKRLLYLARFSESGELVELDFNGSWEYWEESWEMQHVNGWCWTSTDGIEDPTHWAYQDEPIPAATIAPAPTVDVALVQQFLRVLDRCNWLDGYESAWTTKKVGSHQERAVAFTKLRQLREELEAAIAAQQVKGGEHA